MSSTHTVLQILRSFQQSKSKSKTSTLNCLSLCRGQMSATHTVLHILRSFQQSKTFLLLCFESLHVVWVRSLPFNLQSRKLLFGKNMRFRLLPTLKYTACILSIFHCPDKPCFQSLTVLATEAITII